MSALRRSGETVDVSVRQAHRSPADPRKAGGDFALVHRDRGVLTLIVADLWAKGSEADYYSGLLEEAFNAIASAASGPAPILNALNRLFIGELRARCAWEGSATAFVSRYQGDGVLRYAAAGTDDALVFRGLDRHEHLRSTGPLLGIYEPGNYYEHVTRFVPGDVLLVCTDGVTEARCGPSSGGLFGTARVAECVGELLRAPGLPSCDALLERVAAWAGGGFGDDATVLFAIPFRDRAVA